MKKAKALEPSLQEQVQWVLEWLKAHSTKATLDGMSRYAIPSDKGVWRRDEGHEGAGQEARAQPRACFGALGDRLVRGADVDVVQADPSALTAAQMDRWCKEFDNWAYCDTLSFNLFERTPHAWAKVEQWSRERGSSRSERRSRCFGVLLSTTSARRTSSSSTHSGSSSVQPTMTGTSSRRP